MKKKTIETLIRHLDACVKNNDTFSQYEKKHLYRGYFSDRKSDLLKAQESGKIDNETFAKIKYLYEEVSSSKESKTVIEDKSSISINRDVNDRIIDYSFIIPMHNGESLIGILSRENMQQIYRMYSNFGSDISQREVSRYFPEYSLIEFKKILKAFNITKASSPFAPHMIEEKTTDELLKVQFREKENDFIKSYECEKVRYTDQKIKDLLKENYELKQKFTKFSEIVSNLPTIEPKEIKYPKPTHNNTLVIWLSDIHIGASVSEYALFDNSYNEDVVTQRLDTIIDFIGQNRHLIHDVIICNLGDSLDGMDQMTGSRQHILPQNLDNKGQVKTYLSVMCDFFSKLLGYFYSDNICYYCVSTSNHGGITDYTVNLALSALLENSNISTKVFDKNIGVFDCHKYKVCIFHGKTDKTMKQNMPLTINDRWENYINDVLHNYNIKGDNILFVKGDLHQSATTNAKRFTYKSVGSLFGSSEWIMDNFGFTQPCCDYSLICGDQIMDGNIKFKSL